MNTTRLLLVEDDLGHVELLRRHFARNGFSSVLAVHSGEAALEELLGPNLATSPVVVMLDLNMPGSVNGLKVLQRLKQDPRTRAIPVIVLTTSDDPKEVQRCYEAGCNLYIPKPIDPLQFREFVRRISELLSITCLPVGHSNL